MQDPLVGEDLRSLNGRVDMTEFRSKRILITGGAGFLGSWLCDAMVSGGAAIYCVDNLSTGLLGNIQHLISSGGFVFLDSDVSTPELGESEFDMVLHLASRCSPEEYQRHPIQTLEANSRGTQNMLELARKTDAPLLYVSSSEVYGSAEVVPTPESYWGKVNPVGLRSCYDEGKRYGEALCFAYHREYGVDTRIVRLFNTYGPRLRSDGVYARALSRFIEQALSNRDITVYGNGDQTRSFCYVTDTITAILQATTGRNLKGQVFNVGNPRETSILEIAEKIKVATHSRSRITFQSRPPDDPQRRCPDISKIRRILGWSPTIPLEQGLEKTILWLERRRA